jgi:hypothetical protein
MKMYPSFTDAVNAARKQLIDVGYWVHPDQWQSVDVSKKPEMMMREIMNFDFRVVVQGESLAALRKDIKPNLPWADDHFLERVGGEPLNPGVQWAKWPWSNSADKFRTEHGGKFSHTYLERIWPKTANHGEFEGNTNEGIRYSLGDLKDVIQHLAKHPLSRQAYLPIWFPEDTGVVHGERVPCTLGYHFIMRQGHLHMVYDIRSCDIVRHFQDDIYLAVRLQLHVLDQLRELNKMWKEVSPGFFTMHITSLHAFKNDINKFVKDGKWREDL